MLDLNKISFFDFCRLNLHMNTTYEIFKVFYETNVPEIIRKHRIYFASENRGFGEDAFHAMWWYLLKEFRPKKILEIGIYRGQTISLFKLLSKLHKIPIEITGISPLNKIGDSKSIYLDLDYREDIDRNFKYFDLEIVKLIEGFSQDKIVLDQVKESNFDIIYIDGNHDFEYVLSDYNNYKNLLSKNGLIIFDDCSLFEDFNFQGAFKGHPGPSKVVKEFVAREMQSILKVGHNQIFSRTTELQL